MGRTTTSMVLAAALLFIAAQPAVAKDGFYLGINMLFNDIKGDINVPENIESGNGLGLHGGFGFSQDLAIETGIWKTKHRNKEAGKAAELETVTIDLKINFPLVDSHIEPYLLFGAGIFTVEQKGISRDGKGGRVGIGMDVYLLPNISFNVGFTRSNVTFTNNTADIDCRINTMDFGLTYHFI